jgi:hypothetical protein
MIEEELIKIWQSSPNQERIKFEKSRLMIDVQSSIDHLHKQIMYRDLVESIAVIIVIPSFISMAYSIPYTVSKVASLLIVAWAIYVFLRLRGAKKHKPGAVTETYLKYLHKTKEYLHIQKKLLDNVIYWYILPSMIFAFLFLLGFIGAPGKLGDVMGMSAIVVSLEVTSYFLNRAAVKKQILPRLGKVDNLIHAMEKSQ